MSPAGAGTSAYRIAPIDRGEALTFAGVVTAVVAIVIAALAISVNPRMLRVQDLTPVPGATSAGEQHRTGPYSLEFGIDLIRALEQALPQAIDPIVNQNEPGVHVTSSDCFEGWVGPVCTVSYSNGMSQQQTITLSPDGRSFSLPASFDPPTS